VDAAFGKRTVRAGLLVGVGIVYFCLVGMVGAFNDINLVEDRLTLGRLLIYLVPLAAGLLLARPRVTAGESRSPAPGRMAVAGAVAGGIGAVITGLGVLLVDALPDGSVFRIFRSVTPQLLSILTFGKSTGVGLLLLILTAAACGAAAGAIGTAGRNVLRPILIAFTATMLMGMLQNVVRSAMNQLGVPTSWIYSTAHGGLTYLGAVVVFAASLALVVAWDRRGDAVRERVRGMPSEGRKPLLGLGAMVLVLILAVLPLLIGSFLSAVLGRVEIFLLMAIGLNIVVGYAGLLDLGYVAFFAVGAYAMGVLTAAPTSGSSIHPGLSFFEAIPIVIVIAVIAGLLIGAPVLRLRGDYLALVTLGFGEIARVLVTSDALKSFLGGPQGLIAIPAPSIGSISFRDPQPFYYLALAFCLVAIFVSWRLSNSRVGRAWSAMREDEQVAEAMGVSTVKYKLLAFGTGAAIGSLAGSLFAVQIGSLSPASFTILVSITVLAIVILGGMGSIPGVILAALVLIGLPGFLTEFEEFQLLIYGAVLVGIMILKPEGLIPNVRRSRELHEEDREQDVWIKEFGEGGTQVSVAATEHLEPRGGDLEP
jgi:branched-chain amino acid transport system permease protein